MAAFIIFRQASPDAPRDYYLGLGDWSPQAAEAKQFSTAAQASRVCENLQTRTTQTVLFQEVA